MPKTQELNQIHKHADHSACGVVMRVDLDNSHELVDDALHRLAQVEYRSGYNFITGESDGAGIRFFGLPTDFFKRKIQAGQFNDSQSAAISLKDFDEHQYAIGQYFLPNHAEELSKAKDLVVSILSSYGLTALAWRDLTCDLELSILSPIVLQKKPAIWQLIIQKRDCSLVDFDKALLLSALEISTEARKQSIKLNILSQSSDSIVYKGMIKPSELGTFYKDLQDKDFTAHAFINHARFATNTDPQWENAQPCVFFWAHNGELNSVKANALEMRDELDAQALTFKAIYPNAKLSDSMQFDADIANQMALKNISMLEAFTRLMPPNLKDIESDDLKAMIQSFMLERTPYNGPAFAVAGFKGYFVAKLDSVGLRPSRWALMRDEQGRPQFFAASDDLIELDKAPNIISKGHLAPGGMLVFTPDGQLLDTQAALKLIAQAYPEHYFNQRLNAELLELLAPSESVEVVSEYQGATLNRLLYSSGWDYECVEQVIRYMAEHGAEKVAAMGDDTNPLHGQQMPAHLAYFFHQLFAQVSAPPLDSVHESDNFSLHTYLGGHSGKRIQVPSPMLAIHEFMQLEQQVMTKVHTIDLCFELESEEDVYAKFVGHLQSCLVQAQAAARDGGIVVLSDRALTVNKISLPDLLIVAAVRRHLEQQQLIRRVSIVVDSYQVNGPHHASCLLALGANAVYPRGAYAKILELFEQDAVDKAHNYQHALDKCLLKTMGKMGITDVNNYINGHLVAALGLDLSALSETTILEQPSLANIFSGIYSPIKGIGLKHVVNAIQTRFIQAHDVSNDFVIMPYSGYFMPEKNGIKHGYGPVVINAFTAWLKTEEIHGMLARMHVILDKRGFKGFYDDNSLFTLEKGFLDPSQKDAQGYYPQDYLEAFKASKAFRKMITELDSYRAEHPTCIRDYLSLNPAVSFEKSLGPVQSKNEIRSLLFAGSLSQGALTVTDPKKVNQLGAHETLTRGMNAIGANSASGEGGESYEDLRTPLHSTKSKQIASGRFGVSAAQIVYAQEMEIKIAQGAKPGEGGQLPGSKVSIRFAAQRGGLPGTPFISPPPHHDIYSIEDLEQLIFDIKSVNPLVKVAVKLVASQGIGTIAVGVAKAGADVINIASHSGGTGAAQQSSIKHTGLPAEIGLAEVDYALRLAKLRDVVELRVSGGIKTADDVIVSAILGADLFELGTTAMLTLGCKMQRTCNQSCQPGVATDGHLFKGDQLNVERYFVNLAALIHERLHDLGVASLKELRGRTELLSITHAKILELYDFSSILDRTGHQPLLAAMELSAIKAHRHQQLARAKQDQLITEITDFFASNADGIYESRLIQLDNQDRSFGSRIAGHFVQYLEAHPSAKIILNTQGNAGQSFGFVMPKGMTICHQGFVQDGCGKSMSGGELILKTPRIHDNYQAHDHTIAGNVMLYGASGGQAYINGRVGHRFAILCKGSEIVVEGAGDFAFEYMTSGTGLILGPTGHGVGASSSGGIIVAYDPQQKQFGYSDSVRVASIDELTVYESVIRGMLSKHYEATQSSLASQILKNFDIRQFNVLIPKALDKIQSLEGVMAAISTLTRPEANLSVGMKVWLEQKTLELVRQANREEPKLRQLYEFCLSPAAAIFSKEIQQQLLGLLSVGQQSSAAVIDIEDLAKPARVHQTRQLNPVEMRLGGIDGQLDEVFRDAIVHIVAYASELTVDAQGCSGCRAQSCAGGDGIDTGCPSGKQINTINAILQRLGPIKQGLLSIAQWKILRDAFEVQTKESPFIAYTGAACPAPCQDACTESIPSQNSQEITRGNKALGEPVHIKDIEYHLYHLGRALGWFNGQKMFSAEEKNSLFGATERRYQQYMELMSQFKPLFRTPIRPILDKKLVIVGSGPAAMQIAYEALRDGFSVEMYERSNRPGGLLADGIPSHKFDKSFIAEDFANLQLMGLKLFLNHEVFFDQGRQGFYSGDTCIAHANDEHCHVALCLGAGKPVDLPVSQKPHIYQDKIIQAVDLLKAKNDIADALRAQPSLDKEALIAEKLGNMDPRGKKIVVIGGGDTAQDVIRWVARYFNDEAEETKGQLNILIRGLPSAERGVLDGYPAASRAASKENALRDMEVEFIAGDTHHSVFPTKIDANQQTGQLSVHLADIKYRYQHEIEACASLSALDAGIPRELKPRDKIQERPPIEGVDMVILAMGFQKNSSLPLIAQVEEAGVMNVSIAGDSAGVKAKIIVGAQASAHETYQNRIKSMLGLKNTAISHQFFSVYKPVAAINSHLMDTKFGT